MTDLKKFRELVNKHDIAYAFSDDHQVYRAGQNAYDQIWNLVMKLMDDGVPPEHMTVIWNDVVNEKFTAGGASQFHWGPERLKAGHERQKKRNSSPA